jgi:heptosyltransferase II
MAESRMKVGIWLPNWVGDAVMATPAIAALRRQFPHDQFIAVCRPVIAETLQGTDWFDAWLIHQPRGPVAERRGWGFWRKLRSQQLDLAVLLPNSLRSAAWAWASGARRRVGFARDGRQWLLTEALAPRSRTEPHPVMDEYLRLAAHIVHLVSPIQMEPLQLATTPQGEADWQDFVRLHDGVLQNRPYVVFNTGGAFGPAKNWPRESFRDLAQRIVTETPHVVVIACGPGEKDDARWIADNADHPRVVSFAERPLSIGLTKAAVRHAALLVTTDSGPRHFAAAFGIPVVTLYGPTHIAWSETRFPLATHLQMAVDCGPCQQRVCPQGHHRCMRELSVDMVWNAVQQRLGEQQGQQNAA